MAGVVAMAASADQLDPSTSRVLAGHVRATMLWPGAGIVLVPAVSLLNLAPPVLLALLAAVMVAGVATGIAQHRAGGIRTARA